MPAILNILRQSKSPFHGQVLANALWLLALACSTLGCSGASDQGSSFEQDNQGSSFAQVKLAMFSDAACRQPLLQDGQPFVVTMDTSKTCFAFEYTDPEGLVVPTSHANFHCTPTSVSYDKYPFDASCQPSTTRSVRPRTEYTVTSACQFAPSHRGGVYEKLVDYTYPGASDCSAAP